MSEREEIQFFEKFYLSKTDYYVYNNPNVGVFGQDFVRFGSPGKNQLIIPNANFGQTFRNSSITAVDGQLGLGLIDKLMDKVDPPIITAIKSGILDNPIVSIFYDHEEIHSSSNAAGVITFGALDTVNCDRNVIYGPATENMNLILIEQTVVGDEQFSQDWTASIEPSLNVLSFPSSIRDAIIRKTNATNAYSDYNVDCNTKISLNLTIEHTVFTLTEKELIKKFGDNFCILDIGSDAYGPVLGSPWIEAVCNIFDYGSNRLGFAKVISS